MNRYQVVFYEATSWGLLVKHEYKSSKDLFDVTQQLIQQGLKLSDTEWIMPGAILKVEKSGPRQERMEK
jgi:hypothetical protein